MRAVLLPSHDEPVPDLERLDRSLELLLLARAASPNPEVPSPSGPRSRGRDRRRTLRRWAAELGVPRPLAEAIADAIFDREGGRERPREPVVTVELLLPTPPRAPAPIIVAPTLARVHRS